MLKFVTVSCFATIGGVMGYSFTPELFRMFGFSVFPSSSRWIGAISLAIICLLLSIWLVKYVVSFVSWVETRLKHTPFLNIASGCLGLTIGLLIAYMVGPEIRLIPLIGGEVQFFVSVGLGYLGVRIGLVKRSELFKLFFQRTVQKSPETQLVSKELGNHSMDKLLDTSVIIDGRIVELARTGIIDGSLVVPSFVLYELQHLADSSNDLIRNRGRRGLDVLNTIQREQKVHVEIQEIDFEDVSEVDSKLIRLAKQRNATIFTNDFNLNKVCQVQGIPVLNMNDLANAIKQVILPGEELDVAVVKEGKEANQGVGYLEDGTMIVIEGGRRLIGTNVRIYVTSLLQTSSGRMVFAKPKIQSAM
ncbi:PIN/TRAM domain-containing protein [Alicyclobacillus dauci]|uniref:PIN/TRAM domain-containing protein n=1 Tax=Alicyclobacillus dauci TaxID=1475485 RepID=A0ABY6YXJ3_9BACL|nr:PIN/TRAM domain-containing protein [Alicyclobacillus dauci]WAH35251.1 PIN/TRAM domain-containing protein [Alicyclobacillus dauci]